MVGIQNKPVKIAGGGAPVDGWRQARITKERKSNVKTSLYRNGGLYNGNLRIHGSMNEQDEGKGKWRAAGRGKAERNKFFTLKIE